MLWEPLLHASRRSRYSVIPAWQEGYEARSKGYVFLVCLERGWASFARENFLQLCPLIVEVSHCESQVDGERRGSKVQLRKTLSEVKGWLYQSEAGRRVSGNVERPLP